MQFLFSQKGGENPLLLDGEEFNYLFKVRRHRKETPIKIRNRVEPENIYTYSVETIGRREATLKLIESDRTPQMFSNIKVGWCLPSIKTVEKTLPMLNELGVEKLYLIQCDFSQGNTKVDMQRIESILENSSMQSGRIYPMRVETLSSLEEFLKVENPAVLDFVDEVLSSNEEFKTLLIGAEGGFSEDERELFKERELVQRRLPSTHILKSETAVVSAVSRIL
jgi:16S rRNA (uracil1498-N3)-methyltransferase